MTSSDIRPQVVSGDESLRLFRQSNAGPDILALLERGNQLLNWAVGVGKSHNLDEVVEAAVQGDDYDLIIVLLPTREIVNERRLIQSNPNAYKVVNLRPRPAELCGAERDRQWRYYETRRLGQLAKDRLCSHCEHQEVCFWRVQYGEALKGTQVLFCTQTHLQNDPDFIQRMIERCEAVRPLIIFDEATVSLADYKRRITREELVQLITMLRSRRDWQHLKFRRDWLHHLEVLAAATTSDLRSTRGWHPPFLAPDKMLDIQEMGEDTYGAGYRYIVQDLVALGLSPLESREKNGRGDVLFSAPPLLENTVLLYSGTTDPRILEMRLGVPFENAYKDVRFVGAGTSWVNIASSIGSSSKFRRNSDQILDFFAELAAQRIQQGRRVLMISKKQHTSFCIRRLNEMFALGGYTDIRVIPGGQGAELHEPGVIPLIHYGAIGINKFEAYDCAFCINSYYVTETILSDSLQDLRASDEQIDVELSVSGQPKRRQARVCDPRHRYTDVAALAQPMLTALEMGTVIQAVGRVRPFTKPREVITFQNNTSPQVRYDHEFTSLAVARGHYGLSTRRERNKQGRCADVQRLQRQGLTQSKVADLLSISVRTVRRYWSATPDTKPI